MHVVNRLVQASENKVSEAVENKKLELEERRLALEEGKLALERQRLLSSESSMLSIAENQKESNVMMIQLMNGMMQGMKGMIDFINEKK